MKSLLSKKTYHIVSLILLFFVLLYLIRFMHIHMDMLLNADDSSELVLSKLLSDNNEFISKDWAYSTELRVLNTQLIYAPFFRIFQSWHMVRISSLAVMYCIMLAGVFYFCKYASLKELFPVVALIFVLPVSTDYFQFVLRAAYYIPHITINLFQLGMMFKYLNAAKESRCRKYLLPVSFILSVLAGAGGARQLVVLYLPLLLGLAAAAAAGVYNESYAEKNSIYFFDTLKYICAVFFGSAAGFIINAKVLSKIYTFKQWDSINFTAFSAEHFFSVFYGLLTSSGYRIGTLKPGTAVPNAISMVIVAFALWSMFYGIFRYKTVSMEYHMLAVFYAAFLVVFTTLYCVTDMPYRSRYNLPAHLFAFILIIYWIKEVKPRFEIRPVLLTGYVLMLLASSACTFRLFKDRDITSEYRQIAAFLSEGGFEYGYGTFWNSNILTELTDGKIKMHVWLDGNHTNQLENLKDVDYTREWLQAKENATFIPPGRVFAIFSNEEVEHLLLWKDNINKLTPVYSTDKYFILSFKDHDEMASLLEGDTN